MQNYLHIMMNAKLNEVFFHCPSKNNGSGQKDTTHFFRNCEMLQNFADLEFNLIPPVY